MDSKYIVRTVNRRDMNILKVLFTQPNVMYFGHKPENVSSRFLYQYQTHRLIVSPKTASRNLMAYCEFCIYPSNISVLCNDHWLEWIRQRYCLNQSITLMNTMFLNFFFCIKQHKETIKVALMEVFYREHKVDFLLVPRPGKCGEAHKLLEDYGKVYYAKDFNLHSNRNLPTIVVVKRADIMSMITFRRALPEDNDDVVNMLDVEQPELRRNNGDYYIAELLLGTAGEKSEKDQLIVTEDSSEASGSSGMMWLSEDVDVVDLIFKYELEMVNYLVSCTPNEPHNETTFQVASADHQNVCRIYTGSINMEDHGILLQSMERFKLTDKEQLYTRFKCLTDDLRNPDLYLRKVTKQLCISYDRKPDSPRNSGKHGTSSPIRSALKAFRLKSFILHPSLRLEYTYYYLCAMFSAYPDADYCVYTMSSDTKCTVSMLNMLKFFIRMPSRPDHSTSDQLFVCHRYAINAELTVHPFEPTDVEDILDLNQYPEERISITSSMHTTSAVSYEFWSDNVLREIARHVINKPSSEFRIWIICAGKETREKSTLVGFVILRNFMNYDSIYREFWLPNDVANHTYHRGEIITLRLHPCFHMWSDEVLRTIALKAGYRELFFLQMVSGFVLGNDLALKMMPVEPRRMRRNWFTNGPSSEDSRSFPKKVNLPEIKYRSDRYYLYRYNLFSSKYESSQTSLVIIGFSNICKALLRLLIFSWNTSDFKKTGIYNCLTSLNVTVITDVGEVEAEYDRAFTCLHCDRDSECYMFSSNSCPFVMDCTERLFLHNWVHFVSGKVDYIDRKERFVKLHNQCKLHYEHLLLLCDTKYGVPPAILEKLRTSTKCDLPYNYSQQNNRMDKIMLYHKLVELNDSKMPMKRIVVYGSTLDVYECINFLIKHDCKPSEIELVHPLQRQQPEYYNVPITDKKLDGILIQMVTDLGIKVYEAYNLIDIKLYATANFIKTVEFQQYARNTILSLNCDIFINFAENFLPEAIEKSLHKSKIFVKNHQIYVDDKYCTNDPYIYAAGNHVCMSSNVYYQYRFTNEMEMAQKLLRKLRMIPQAYTRPDHRFSQSMTYHALLPMGYMIYRLTMPKRYLLGKLPNEYNHVMTTYERNEFCRVCLNGSLIIEEITCVTKNLEKPLYFLEFFCGRHDALLNSLKTRFKMNLITNFIKFFEEPWTELLMHDRYTDLQNFNQSLLNNLLVRKNSILDDLDLNEDGFRVACRHLMTTNTLRFLRLHRREFANEFLLPEDWNVFEPLES